MPNPKNMTPDDLAACNEVARLYYNEKQRSGWTQKTLAGIIGKSSKTVSAIIRGNIRVTIDVADNLSKFFGVPLTQILAQYEDSLSEDHINEEMNGIYSKLSDENQKAIIKMMYHMFASQKE